MSWADANLNDDPTDVLVQRITDLENTISTQLSELRHEIGLAAAAGHGDGSPAPAAMLGDLEEQFARAVTVSLSAALEAIRESLTDAVAEAVQQLASQPAPAARAQWDGPELEEVAATLQHAVLLALSSFDQPKVARSATDPFDGPATARDVARVNQRIDELRQLLLG